MPEQTADSQNVELIRQKVSAAGLTPPVASDGRPSAQVTFAAVEGGTLVDVHILGQPHPAGPALIPVAMPELGMDGIKVVREAGQRLEVLSFSG
jgi:CheY-like chemotaxis protein